ncbi:EAL and HDOD domain-containing protein [Thalassomonas haliotis]|uniref:HDOD domain-containing protein n=1 Tax=Thalassomonas haliotis TaxID=485448 RepID=A0ABY7VAC3_9GAMM|nr:HDOD domain-containing protein [Thalassomonas haliotis]WDE09848.1 HDOD domain-containing protein [Thalassomonas haliotis]
MHSTYIARQAILDRKSRTIGYELLFRDSPDNKFPEIDPDVASAKVIIQNHIHGDIAALTLGKTAFINFTEYYLLNKFPLLFDKKSIVIELVGHEFPSERLIKIIKYYHEKGYKIALTEYDLAEHWDVLLPYLYLIKIDVKKINVKRLKSLIDKARSHQVLLAAEKVETRFQLQSLAEVGFNYFQGFFYHEPEIVTGQTLSPIKAQMLKLISESAKSPLDFDAIAEILAYDVNLSISLLKLVNNVASGTKVAITSIKQAAAYLGEKKLKQFVAILALSKLSTEETDEIARQSLITARLMSELAQKSDFKQVKDFAFITGLLSAMEVILAMPMADILRTMPLAKPIEEALIHRSGLLGKLLSMTSHYIIGDNGTLIEKFSDYSLSAELIQQEFVSASKWCSDLTQA